MTGVSTLAKGEDSGVTSPRRVIVRDEPGWRALWAEHAGLDDTAPDVDFRTQMVAAVFAGDRPSAGYAVEIVDARRTADTLTLVTCESRPQPGMMSAQIIVSPFHIVALPRFDGAVSFI
jgi:hypothetical protein